MIYEITKEDYSNNMQYSRNILPEQYKLAYGILSNNLKKSKPTKIIIYLSNRFVKYRKDDIKYLFDDDFEYYIEIKNENMVLYFYNDTDENFYFRILKEYIRG